MTNKTRAKLRAGTRKRAGGGPNEGNAGENGTAGTSEKEVRQICCSFLKREKRKLTIEPEMELLLKERISRLVIALNSGGRVPARGDENNENTAEKNVRRMTRYEDGQAGESLREGMKTMKTWRKRT